jgi:hypothetical protein
MARPPLCLYSGELAISTVMLGRACCALLGQADWGFRGGIYLSVATQDMDSSVHPTAGR